MASEVDIANLALGHLGDDANVASLNPPEGSAQAGYCARFYPIARDSLLELGTWGFATKRVQLAQLTSNWSSWAYCYAQPSDAIKLLAVIAPTTDSDYVQTVASGNSIGVSGAYTAPVSTGAYAPQPYSVEMLDDGTNGIYTDQEDAVLRYVARVTDTTKFSSLFTLTLSWHLAAMLAGPLIKGDAGAAEAKRCAAMAQAYLAKAGESDANQRKADVQHIVPWLSRR